MEAYKEEFIEFMRKKGFEPAIGRCAYRLTEKRQALRIGYFGAIPNRQFDYDHRNDLALILDEDYVSRRLRAVRNAYEKRKAAAEVCSGPICLESYGDVPFSPKPCSGTPEFTDQQQKYYVNLTNETGQITDRYQSGDRHTFTIMLITVVILVIITQIIQEIGNRWSKGTDKRIR